MKAHERFLRYVKYSTASSDVGGAHPSTETQRVFAAALAEELRELGCSDVYLSEDCYVYARLGASEGCRGNARLGFIAHLDTAPDFSGENVSPIIHENYDGGDIALPYGGRVLSPNKFPSLSALKGRTLITADGSTLLGADDKAGISEIMTMLEVIQNERLPHGELRIAFTPDEEIGEGADGFDIQRFDADFAYTVDGGAEGSLEYENFNAASASLLFRGVNVHPGDAKDKMINASLVAMEANAMLPMDEVPSMTSGYQGFFHLTDISGNVESATLSYIVRDHDEERFKKRLSLMRDIEAAINEKYGDGTVCLTLKHQYKNMSLALLEHMHLIDNAKEAIEALGLTPVIEPIRGGTDGARLSFMGLPCPNLETGGHAFHGPFEHISAEGMELSVRILLGLVEIYKDFKAR